jgi:hypothetical protein
MSLKETVRLFSDLVIHCLWKCVWQKECQFVIERCNWSLPQRWLLKPTAWSPQSCLIDRKADLPSYSNNLPRIHFPGWAPCEPIGASLVAYPTKWARVRPFHGIKVWEPAMTIPWQIHNFLKKSCSTQILITTMDIWSSLEDYVIKCDENKWRNLPPET